MPSASKKRRRSAARFEMRLAIEEQSRLREDADLTGLTMSELARRRILQRPVQSATDLTMIRELRRLGGLQKFAISKCLQHREAVAECIATIKALRAAIERVANHDRETNR